MSEDHELEHIRLRKIQTMLDQAVASSEKFRNHPINVTDGNFQDAVAAHELLVVDFWAPWCGPCRTVGPIIEQLAAEYSGQVTFGKMNVDENQMVPSRFGVMSIPTLIVFYKGQAVETIVGAHPKTHIEAAFKQYLGTQY